ncbi:hypothetical protein CSKR_200042 [Clonorchis sinensis]|uniref:Uncharacterized protein n=1 Tax=Clonorchis sinensis TaxID=79923 RepID=A0A8T1LYU6_CLOSI|nr:hypothetical protein CSKR_200042 [Clonorchis sinensis]
MLGVVEDPAKKERNTLAGFGGNIRKSITPIIRPTIRRSGANRTSDLIYGETRDVLWDVIRDPATCTDGLNEKPSRPRMSCESPRPQLRLIPIQQFGPHADRQWPCFDIKIRDLTVM